MKIIFLMSSTCILYNICMHAYLHTHTHKYVCIYIYIYIYIYIKYRYNICVCVTGFAERVLRRTIINSERSRFEVYIKNCVSWRMLCALSTQFSINP